MLELKNLSVEYGKKVLLDNVRLSVKSGEIAVLLGRSGSGKTLSLLSFFDLLPANLKKTSGEILYDNKKINLQNTRGRLFSMIMQNPISCFNPLFSIKSHFAESCFDGYNEKHIESLLSEVALNPNILSLYPFELSGGMLQRVMIALSLVNNVRFLLLDEATSDIDGENVKRFLTLLDSIKKNKNIGILVVTHDLRIALNIADSIYIMKNGKIVSHFAELKSLDSKKITQNMLIDLMK